MRIEDLDLPRVVSGSADLILQTLEQFGFEWDEAVVYQSTRTPAYEDVLQILKDKDLAYPCSCTRSELQALAHHSTIDSDELRYPGICRTGPCHAHGPYSWRFRVPVAAIPFNDTLQGAHRVNLAESIGDFVVKRRDGLFAYQLAVVVDDAYQRITEVVRGADLLFNTPRQLALQQALGFSSPTYMHLPLAIDPAGKKLSKSSHAPEVQSANRAAVLWQALVFLQQQPPSDLRQAALSEVWSWAIKHWQPHRLCGVRMTVAAAATANSVCEPSGHNAPK